MQPTGWAHSLPRPNEGTPRDALQGSRQMTTGAGLGRHSLLPRPSRRRQDAVPDQGRCPRMPADRDGQRRTAEPQATARTAGARPNRHRPTSRNRRASGPQGTDQRNKERTRAARHGRHARNKSTARSAKHQEPAGGRSKPPSRRAALNQRENATFRGEETTDPARVDEGKRRRNPAARPRPKDEEVREATT